MAAPPANADYTVFSCKAWEQTHDSSGSSHAASRCFEGIPWADCKAMIDDAYNKGLTTLKAQQWNTYWQWCPLVYAGKIQSVCPAGCFAGNTQLTDGEGSELSISEASEGVALKTLSDNSSTARPNLQGRAIDMAIRGPEAHDLYIFQLSNGRELRVTENHAMVLASGRLVKARNVRTSDAFVDATGASVPVLAIYREPATSDVYNVRMKSSSFEGHVVVAEGVLAGDNYLQNAVDGEEEMAISARRE
ncbi:Hint domain-containing protein [Pendulispora rubella]|uniref:Hint domain-containing protein n=1 Tax=Pendulispora rubella TaxID=2741070 RepID=A0ABZ2LNY9_9BACT